MRADEVRIRQVLDNLVSNAIKYSPNGGTITVGGEAKSDRVTIYVRDEGVGITEQDQEHIFDRFFRVDGALSRSTEGTGLGLYLAKAVIEAHGGSIHVTSKPGVRVYILFHYSLIISSLRLNSPAIQFNGDGYSYAKSSPNDYSVCSVRPTSARDGA